MKLTFCGGVGEVTGSRHWLQAEGLSLLLDCGLFQGHRGEAIAKNRYFQFTPADLDYVLLSHAHIDHSGGLPLLAKAGYKGKILCADPTPELCRLMLIDSAHLHEQDAKFFNKINADRGVEITPLYDKEDAQRCLNLFEGHAYQEHIPLNERVRARFHNAGHVLGSAMIEIEVDAEKGKRRVLFTGDLGRRRSLLMEPPQVPRLVDYLMIETTYGDRAHEPIAMAEEQLKRVVARAVAEKGKILIPSFALERTQEIVFVLEKLRRRGEIPALPIYVDSPMAVSISDLFHKHKDGFSFGTEFRDYAEGEGDGDPFGFESIQYVRSLDESKSLNDIPGPMVIISASGMCEGGRILHHLRNNIGKDETTILMVGYQAKGTLGRRLLDGAKKVKIFGLEHEVWARVESIHSLSAHADRDDLLSFIKALEPRPRKIFLVHGDAQDRAAFAEQLRIAGINRVECPGYGESFELA